LPSRFRLPTLPAPLLVCSAERLPLLSSNYDGLPLRGMGSEEKGHFLTIAGDSTQV
jgi:hypothetical protein